MAKELSVKLQEAYDTETNWKKSNPVLLAGQLAFSSDKYGKYKVGDGIKTWSQLSYITTTWNDISGKPSSMPPSAHNHDDRYYTETEIDQKLNEKINTGDLTSHTENTTVHITSTERTNWNSAKTHASSTHAPSNAQPNQNAFSNITINDTTISADNATDTLNMVAGNNVTITPDAANDKITITAKDTVYTHPSTHSSSMITQDSTHRFVTDNEKSNWNTKTKVSIVRWS